MTSRVLKQLETTLLTPSKSGVTQVPADQEWKHPAELIFSTGRYWTNKKLFYYCIANALSFTVSSSNPDGASSSPSSAFEYHPPVFKPIPLSDSSDPSLSPDLLYVSDGKKTVVINDKYRLPLIYLSYWQWGKLRKLMCPETKTETEAEGTPSSSKAESSSITNWPPRSPAWGTEKFEVLHIARAWKILTDEGPSPSILNTPSYGPAVTKAQRIEGIRRWRCHTLDRILNRFRKGCFSNESGKVEEFWTQWGEKAYEGDILDFDWRLWLSEPRNGITLPPSQFTSGLNPDNLMEGLKEKDGAWYWDLSSSSNALLPPLPSSSLVSIPADATSASSLRATAANLFGKTPKRSQTDPNFSTSARSTPSKTPSKSKSPPTIKSSSHPPFTPSPYSLSSESVSAVARDDRRYNNMFTPTPSRSPSPVPDKKPLLEPKQVPVTPALTNDAETASTLSGAHQHKLVKTVQQLDSIELQVTKPERKAEVLKEMEGVGADSATSSAVTGHPNGGSSAPLKSVASPGRGGRITKNAWRKAPLSQLDEPEPTTVKAEESKKVLPEVQEGQNPPRVRRAQNAISVSTSVSADTNTTSGTPGSHALPPKPSIAMIQATSGPETGAQRTGENTLQIPPSPSLKPPKPPSYNVNPISRNGSLDNSKPSGPPPKPTFGPPRLPSVAKPTSSLPPIEKPEESTNAGTSSGTTGKDGGAAEGSEPIARESVGPPRTKPKMKLPDFVKIRPQNPPESSTASGSALPAALERKMSGSTPIPTPTPTPTPALGSLRTDLFPRSPSVKGPEGASIMMPARTPSRSGTQSSSPVTPTFTMNPPASASYSSASAAVGAQLPPVTASIPLKPIKVTPGRPILQVSTSSSSVASSRSSTSNQQNAGGREITNGNESGNSNKLATPPSPTSPIYAKSTVPLPTPSVRSRTSTPARTPIPTPTGTQDNKLKRPGSPLEKPGSFSKSKVETNWYGWSGGSGSSKEPELETDEIPGLGNFPSPAYTRVSLPASASASKSTPDSRSGQSTGTILELGFETGSKPSPTLESASKSSVPRSTTAVVPSSPKRDTSNGPEKAPVAVLEVAPEPKEVSVAAAAAASLPTPFSASINLNSSSFSLAQESHRAQPPDVPVSNVSKASTSASTLTFVPAVTRVRTHWFVPVPLGHLFREGGCGDNTEAGDKMNVDGDVQMRACDDVFKLGVDAADNGGLSIHPMHPLAHLLGAVSGEMRT